MSLSSKSLFTYGIQVSSLNNKIDFKSTSGGAELHATLNLGFYSPGGLANQIALQLQTADPNNIYNVTVARDIMGGTQNRITISTNGSYLSLLFSSGVNANISAASLMGFNSVDYTGSTTYSGSSSTGTTFMPDYIGYNYLDDMNQSKLFGAVNVSASGLKEAVTFNIQLFIDVEYKYEPKSKILGWKNFFTWSIQQRQFDYTPEISNPTNVFNVTLEQTQYEDQGLGYQMNEMLPDYPNCYQTGPLKFRIIPNTSQFTGGT